jgi:integrase
MSVYFTKTKGWRYDLPLNGTRYTKAGFKTKKAAKEAEAKRREELTNPIAEQSAEMIKTAMLFLELANLRLDHVKAYNSEAHYNTYKYQARRWVKEWESLTCDQITQAMVQRYLLERRKVSAYTANKELRYLRATWNFGVRLKLVTNNPTGGIEFFPVEKKVKYVPCAEDLDKVIACADPDNQDYLWTIRETMGRVSEINRLTWDDVDFQDQSVTLYTRKKKGGHLTPRRVPMTRKLNEILARRYKNRDLDKPWIFWHRYWSRKLGRFVEGPYGDRKKLMKRLCEKAGVRYFRFHPIRHSGASIMDGNGVPLGAIQRILGHENRRTTEIYLHSMGDSERDAMRVFEQARQKSPHFPHTGT